MPAKRAGRRGAPATVEHPPPPAHFGALSLDKGPPPSTVHLAPPDDPSFNFGFSSSSSSSLVSTPLQQARAESPDLAMLGASLPTPTPPPPPRESESPELQTTLGAKTFNAKAEMPKWMQEVTSGFAKEMSQLMSEMDELRKEKAKIQMEIANLMGTLSQYSSGGQFAPRHWLVLHPHSLHTDILTPFFLSLIRSQPATPEPQTSEPEPESTALAVVAPAKPGWRTIKPQPKKIHSKVVNTPKALPAPPTPPQQRLVVTPPVHPTPKLPSWTTWKPAGRTVSGGQIKAPAPKPPVIPPGLFGE